MSSSNSGDTVNLQSKVAFVAHFVNFWIPQIVSVFETIHQNLSSFKCAEKVMKLLTNATYADVSIHNANKNAIGKFYSE